MTWNRGRRRWVLAALATGALALLVVTPAVAEPPPPDFINFTITNGTNQPVENLTITVYRSVGRYQQIATEAEAIVTYGTVPPCGTVPPFSLPDTFGIARIECTAECPPGHQLTAHVDAHQYDFVKAVPGPEYAGFTSTDGAGNPAPLGVEFLAPTPPQTEVIMHLACWARWNRDPGLLRQDPVLP